MNSDLATLITAFEASAPSERMNLRDSVLAHGEKAIAALSGAAERQPKLNSSIAAWLETLAKREPALRPQVVRAVAGLAARDKTKAVVDVLERLTGRPGPAKTPRKTGPQRRTAAEAEVYAKVIAAARKGIILTYSDLETSRGHVGRYLHHIALAEAALGHPPLTAIVVSKTNGRPGPGFIPAMEEIGYAHRGEKMEPVWARAVPEVHAYWRIHPTEGVPAEL